MKNPGPIAHSSPYHVALLAFSDALAERFDMKPGPMLGLLLKLDEHMGKAIDTGLGMSALKIAVEAEDEP